MRRPFQDRYASSLRRRRVSIRLQCERLEERLQLSTVSPQSAPTLQGNPWHMTVVHFAAGTSDAQMRDAVTQAGGEVVTDLSPLNAVDALPNASDFASRIKADPRVKAAWEDRLISIPEADVADGAGSPRTRGSPATMSPQPGPPSPLTEPDPWHNLPSGPIPIFGNETNPEGILQWDDNRMNVPAAWTTTTGQTATGRPVRVAVLDTGVQGSHKELQQNYDFQRRRTRSPRPTEANVWSARRPGGQLEPRHLRARYLGC